MGDLFIEEDIFFLYIVPSKSSESEWTLPHSFLSLPPVELELVLEELDSSLYETPPPAISILHKFNLSLILNYD